MVGSVLAVRPISIPLRLKGRKMEEEAHQRFRLGQINILPFPGFVPEVKGHENGQGAEISRDKIP